LVDLGQRLGREKSECGLHIAALGGISEAPSTGEALGVNFALANSVL
jgi:hypothetical protein